MLAEQLCSRYFESTISGRSILIGRLFNATGPRETNPHLLAEVTRQIAVEGSRSIQVGNLWPLRDYVDVESLAAANVDATIANRGLDILNFGSGSAVGVGEVLRMLTSVLPFAVDLKSVAERQRPNDRPCFARTRRNCSESLAAPLIASAPAQPGKSSRSIRGR